MGNSRTTRGFGTASLLALGMALCSLYTCPAKAEGVEKPIKYQDVGGVDQEKAVNSYIQRFVKFTQNKDVMGQSERPDWEGDSRRPEEEFQPR